MSRKTSIYLNPLLEQLVEAKPQPLTEALYRGLAVEPLLAEENEEGGFTTHWYCAVPPKGSRFKVHHEYWRGIDSRPIREIYKVEVTDQ